MTRPDHTTSQPFRTSGYCRSAARAAAALSALTALAFATPAPAAERVLPPAATAALQQAFESVRACRIDEIRVDRNYAEAQLCLRRPPSSCFSVRLDDPEAGCDGEETGPWCLHWISGEPPDELRDAVRQALGASEGVWIQPQSPWAPEPLPRSKRAEGPVQLPLRSLARALAYVAVPLLAGAMLGRLWRGRWWLRFAGAVAVVALSFVAFGLLQQVGAWDVLSVGGLLGGGLLMGGALVDRRSTLLLVASSALALGALEWAVRRWLPPPPQFPSPEDATFIIKPGEWDAGCSVLYGPAGLEPELRHLHSAPERPRKRGPLVVHLGDSMTFGEGVREAEAFPALLDVRSPDVAHANYGVWAVGTDFEYLLLEKVLALHPIALVVLHVYLGNDIYDIDRPYECCDAGPLLNYASGGPTARCPSAHWRFTLAAHLGRSPPPYPLRVATAWSYAARHAAAAFSRLVYRLDLPPNFISSEGDGSEQGWDHFAQILAKMRDELGSRGVDLIVDLLPYRQALESSDPTATPAYRARRRVSTITAQLGIPTLDAWDLFAGAVKRDGASRYFRGEHDIHFTPEGHRLLAGWLTEQLPPASRDREADGPRG